MPNLEEENYLDSLLKSMDENSDEIVKNDTENSVGDIDISEILNAGFDADGRDSPSFDMTDNFNDVVSIDDSVYSGVENNADAENVSDFMSGMEADLDSFADIGITDDSSELNNNDMISGSYDDINNDDGSFGQAGEELSQSDLEKLADMGLDELIEDVTGDTLSVEDLFGAGEDMVQDIFADQSMNLPENTTGSVSNTKNDNGSVINEINDAQDLKVSPEDVFDNANNLPEDLSLETNEETDTNDTDPDLESSELSQEFSETEIAAALGEGDVSIETGENEDKFKQQKKKKKFNLFRFIRNIFIEDIKDIEAENTKTELTKETLADEHDSDHIIDENEKLLEEMYGSRLGDGSPEEEEEKEPPKGFFAKIKYNRNAKKEKRRQEDKAEQEAEEQETEEKRQKKQEKQDAKNAQKEEKQKAKESQQEGAPKKEKKKKEKLKETPRTQDIMKIKPISLIKMILLVSGVVVLLHILNWLFFYNSDLNNAKLYFQNGNFEKAYEQIEGSDIQKSDEYFYEQIRTIMYVQVQYSSYENYIKMGMGTEALDSLIKGIERYDFYNARAQELGVDNQINEVKLKIADALLKTFKITEDKARSYALLSKTNFTQYYRTIEGYGGMVSGSSN